MKKILVTFLALPLMAHAADEPSEPFSGNGLQIVPFAEQRLPESMKLEIKKEKLEVEKNGFHQTSGENTYAQYLFNLKRNANDEIRAYRGTQNVYDTHLKQSFSDIKLAFQFKKLPVSDKDIIGYTATGTYVKSPEGWNGIKVFFTDKTLGICAYEFTDLNLSNGGVQLVKEDLKYTINNKPTSTVIEGNQSSGFTYSVIWYDGIKVNTVDCAQKDYSKATIGKVIALANDIAKSR